jgi:hypothetical protein
MMAASTISILPNAGAKIHHRRDFDLGIWRLRQKEAAGAFGELSGTAGYNTAELSGLSLHNTTIHLPEAGPDK